MMSSIVQQGKRKHAANAHIRFSAQSENTSTHHFDDALTNLERAAPAIQAGKKSALVLAPINCPCCNQRVTVPTLEIVIDRYGVTPLEAKILGAVWKGKGMPVMTERVFDAMYADDSDGGPSPTRMYLAFKVALCHLRARLKGSGITIENVGYRQGYRLILGSHE